MKKLLLLGLIILQACGANQQVFTANTLHKEVIYENLQKSQNELYILSNDWMVDAFINANSVIQFTDKEEGAIIGKYYLTGQIINIYGSINDQRIYAKIDVRIQDNRVKLEVIPTTDINASTHQIMALRTNIQGLFDSFENHLKTHNIDW